MKKLLPLIFFSALFLPVVLHAQQDSAVNKKFSLHFQSTVIPQYHFDFNSPYMGDNSMLPHEPVRTSFTATLYAAYKFARRSYIVFNPEAAGGKGLSKTLGVAGFPNGEIYRVGDPAPKPYIARLYVEQRFPLTHIMEQVDNDANQVQEYNNRDYISVLAGKFSLTDFFGNVDISHDPRTQFLNWSLMGHGGWDYPANTRGYTFGVVVKVVYKDWFFNYANTFVPTEANGMNLQWKGGDAMGMVWEAGNGNLLRSTRSARGATLGFHAGVFVNKARMGSYAAALRQPAPPDVTLTRTFGRTKWGLYANLEGAAAHVHYFIKGSWNDGRNETWAFTEIDRSMAAGLQLDGALWKRSNDKLGVGLVGNGLSTNHRHYLAEGGYGFLIGDGRLNYGVEGIGEVYYSLWLAKFLYLSVDYQYIMYPAYNRDRGPVSIMAARLHIEL